MPNKRFLHIVHEYIAYSAVVIRVVIVAAKVHALDMVKIQFSHLDRLFIRDKMRFIDVYVVVIVQFDQIIHYKRILAVLKLGMVVVQGNETEIRDIG